MHLNLFDQDTASQTRADTVQARTEMPPADTHGLERVMLPHDKIFVVLAVVLVIWFGILYFLFRTDRKIDRLERAVKENISDGVNT